MKAADIIRETGNTLNVLAICRRSGVSYERVLKAVKVRGWELKTAEETALRTELFRIMDTIKTGLDGRGEGDK